MRKMPLLIIAVFLLVTISDADDLTAFKDPENELTGFKNSKGKTVISPGFFNPPAQKFLNIIAVTEIKEGNKFSSYYLTRNGRKVGLGMHYNRDNTPDCESDGTIRFRNKNGVGYFDKNGNVLIKGQYSDSTQFKNGFAIALKGAKKICFNGKEYSKENRCEHFRWVGGNTYLIDKNNKIIIRNFIYTKDLDWYSLIIADKKLTGIRDSFKGTNDKYYSFINTRKEFAKWFKEMLTEKDISLLAKCSMESIYYWSNKEKRWIKEKSRKYLEKNKVKILKRLKKFKTKKDKYSIIKEELNNLIFEDKYYLKYLDNCGYSLFSKHPVFKVMVSKKRNNITSLDPKNYFEFLRVDRGKYKLIGIGFD